THVPVDRPPNARHNTSHASNTPNSGQPWQQNSQSMVVQAHAQARSSRSSAPTNGHSSHLHAQGTYSQAQLCTLPREKELELRRRLSMSHHASAHPNPPPPMHPHSSGVS